ncbi:TetR/AcrR family transcriptional regulator [Streptomyces griseoluteus]|uniref:TetR/AcrR family transcriptional regulator n=1 Tax=Streptomyces griseoluteus TaxID=29306 RepID=UPI0033DAE6C6
MTDSTALGQPLRRDAARNRELIVAAARDLFAESGLHVPYDEIGRRAGVGVGTVYRRFPQRDDLIVTLFDRRVADLAKRGDEALEMDDAWTALRSFVEGVMTAQAGDRGFAQVLTRSALYGRRVETCAGQLRPRLAALVERAHQAGVIRPDIGAADFEMLMTMLISMAHPNTELWRRYAAVFFDGITTDLVPRERLPADQPTESDLRQLVLRWVH